MADIRNFFGGGSKKPAPKANSPTKKPDLGMSPYFSIPEEDEDMLVITKKPKKPESLADSHNKVLASPEKKKRKKVVDEDDDDLESEVFEQVANKPAPKNNNHTKPAAATSTPQKKTMAPPENPPPPPIIPMDANTFFGTNDVKPLSARPKKKMVVDSRTKQEQEDASLALALQLQEREERRAHKPVAPQTGAHNHTSSTTSSAAATKSVVTSPYFNSVPALESSKKESTRRSPNKIEEKPARPSSSSSSSSSSPSSVKSEPLKSSSTSAVSSTIKPAPTTTTKPSAVPSSTKPPVKVEPKTLPPPSASITSPSRPLPTSANVGGSPPPLAKRGSNFAAYKQRGGPLMAGQVEIPEGQPYCLAGLTFVMTGVLDSLDAEAFKDLIQKYGGRVTGDVSGKTSYLVRGTEPGESKSAKAVEKNIPIIDEPALLELIRTLPENVPGGEKSKKSKKAKKGDDLPLPPPAVSKATPMVIANDIARPPQNNNVLNITHSNARVGSTLESKVSSFSSSSSSSFSSRPIDKPQDTSGLLWVDKYKPSNPSQIIGNNENVNRITQFLRTWQEQFLDNKKTNNTKRAVLISGPPGTGKTSGTTAIAKSLGYEVIEFNASDLRNQAAIEEQISELSSNRAMTEFYRQDQGKVSKHSKTCLIMDEVDGMSGSDRGGIAKLIQIIKKSKIPIVCICNDGKDRKLQSLKNYCLDITWRRPQPRSIAERLVKIAHHEGLMMDIPSIERMCEMTHADIRQVLHLIQLWAKNDTQVSFDEAKNRMAKAEKDFDLGPFDVCNKFFQVPVIYGPKKENWLDDRIDAYFVDADLLPLMVHQNYLSCKPAIGRHGECKVPPGKEPPKLDVLWMESFSTAADYISWGDIVSNKLRTENDWSLAPTVGVLSTVAPGATIAGGMGGMMGFPAWLGKNSTTQKNMRLIREISTVMSMDCPCSSRDMGLYYLPLIRYKLLAPMIKKGAEGIEDVIEVMTEYALTREDWSDIVELGEGFAEGLRQSEIDSKIKAAFTRRFNGELILAKVTRPSDKNFKPTKMKGEGATQGGGEFEEEEEAEENVNEDEESIEKDKSIRVIKTPAARGKGTTKVKDESKTRGKAESKTSKAKPKPKSEPKPRIPKKK